MQIFKFIRGFGSRTKSEDSKEHIEIFYALRNSSGHVMFSRPWRQKSKIVCYTIFVLCTISLSLWFPECYVADEVITSRAGKRIRVGNTDAEGRMVMSDVLCRMKELVRQFSVSFLFRQEKEVLLTETH